MSHKLHGTGIFSEGFFLLCCFFGWTALVGGDQIHCALFISSVMRSAGQAVTGSVPRARPRTQEERRGERSEHEMQNIPLVGAGSVVGSKHLIELPDCCHQAVRQDYLGGTFAVIRMYLLPLYF